MEEERWDARAEARELMSVFQEFKRGTRRPSADGMKPGEMAVMGTVAHHHVETGEGIRISEIAKILKIANPTVTQFINGLEKTGWVYRVMDAQDRRSVLVSLTEEGMAQYRRFEAGMTQLFRNLAEFLGPEDAGHLIRIMRKTLPFMKQMQEEMRFDQDGKQVCHGSQAKETETTC